MILGNNGESQNGSSEDRDRVSEANIVLLLLDCIDPLISALEHNTTRVLALATILQREGYDGEASILLQAARTATGDLLAGQLGLGSTGSDPDQY